MKTKSIFKLAVTVLLLGASVSARAYYGDDNYMFCQGMKATWDVTERKFTLSNLHPYIKEPWTAFLLDNSWCDSCYVDLTPNGTFVPGSSTFKTIRLEDKYGDPLKDGANGLSNLFVAIRDVNNNTRIETCYRYFNSSTYNLCDGEKAPTYCKNFNATFSGSIINVTGILNCSTDNLFMIATSDLSKWHEVSIKVDPTHPDKGSADVSALQFYNTKENVYPYAKGVMFYMNSDNEGGDPSRQGPNYCSKTFTPPIQNSTSDITTNSITISPNPATPSETITITISGEYASDAKVSITSTSGSIVGSVIPSVGADAMTVSLSGLNLQAGIYFIRIESGDKVFSGKLCVK
jgi:hypothetical protein